MWGLNLQPRDQKSYALPNEPARHRWTVIAVAECFCSWKLSQHFQEEGRNICRLNYCGLMALGEIQANNTSGFFIRETIISLKLKSEEVLYKTNLWYRLGLGY